MKGNKWVLSLRLFCAAAGLPISCKKDQVGTVRGELFQDHASYSLRTSRSFSGAPRFS